MVDMSEKLCISIISEEFGAFGLEDQLLLLGEVGRGGQGVEGVDAVVLAHVLEGRRAGAGELVVLLLAYFFDVEGTVAAEDLGEDFLLVVELQAVALGLVEGLLELLLLLQQQFLEGADLLEVLLPAGPLLDELLHLLQAALVDLDLVLPLALDL